MNAPSRSVLVLLLLDAGAAYATPQTRIAVTPFVGLHADEPQGAVMRAFRSRAALLPAAQVPASGAKVIIGGIVDKRENKLQLTVTATVAQNGSAAGELHYPMSGRHLSGEQLRQISREVITLARNALVAAGGLEGSEAQELQPGQGGEAPTSTGDEPAAEQSADTENAFDAGLDRPAIREQMHFSLRAPRPHWAPYVDASVGVIIGSRALSFNPAGGNPGFTGGNGTGAGIHADLTLYPLAFMYPLWRGVLAGLGGGVTLDVPFWPNAQQDGSSQRFAVHELRVEGGLRWRLVVRKRIPRVETTLLAGAGLHSFKTSKRTDANTNSQVDLDVPDVSYVYGAFGLGLRVFAKEWATAWIDGNVLYVPDSGPIENLDEYGLSHSLYGLRGRAGVDFFVWRGLKVGVSGYYEWFALKFGKGNIAQPIKTASAAGDNYFGGVITAGYVF